MTREHIHLGPRFLTPGTNPYPDAAAIADTFEGHLSAWCRRRENWPSIEEMQALREEDRIAQEACAEDRARRAEGDTELPIDMG